MCLRTTTNKSDLIERSTIINIFIGPRSLLMERDFPHGSYAVIDKWCCAAPVYGQLRKFCGILLSSRGAGSSLALDMREALTLAFLHEKVPTA